MSGLPGEPAAGGSRFGGFGPWLLGCGGLVGFAGLAGVLGLVALLTLLPDPEPDGANGTGLAAAPGDGGASLKVPAASSRLTMADLVGEWGTRDGLITTYVDKATGAYAGSDALHFTSTWTITGEGTITQDFSGLQNGRKIQETSSGTVRLDGGVLAIAMRNRQRYVIRGFEIRPEGTVMKLNGPWYDDPIPSDIFSNPEQGANLDQLWVRRN